MEECHNIGVTTIYNSTVAEVDITGVPCGAIFFVGTIDQISIFCYAHNFKLPIISNLGCIVWQAASWTECIILASGRLRHSFKADWSVWFHAWRIRMVVIDPVIRILSSSETCVIGRQRRLVWRLWTDDIISRSAVSACSWENWHSIERNSHDLLGVALSLWIVAYGLDFVIECCGGAAHIVVQVLLRAHIKSLDIAPSWLEGDLEIYFVFLGCLLSITKLEAMVGVGISLYADKCCVKVSTASHT
jgi:hypothetical protein